MNRLSLLVAVRLCIMACCLSFTEAKAQNNILISDDLPPEADDDLPPESVDTKVPTTEQFITTAKPLKWNLYGKQFSLRPKFKYSDYIYYKSLPKSPTNRNDYAQYAGEHASHRYLVELARQLYELISGAGYTKNMLAEYVTAFVQQSITYTPDPQNRPFDTPLYPIETVLSGGGDCEDKAALLVALLNTFGLDAVLIELPGHMAAGISTRDTIMWRIIVNQYKSYAFIEATSPDMAIGEMQLEYRAATFHIIIPPAVNKYNYMDEEIEGSDLPPEADIPAVTTVPRSTIPQRTINQTKPQQQNTVTHTTCVGTATINGKTYPIRQGETLTVTAAGNNVIIYCGVFINNNVGNNNGNNNDDLPPE